MVLPQLGQRKAIVDPAEKAGRLVWIRRDGHLRGSLRIFTDDDFHVAVEVVGRHDQIQWRGHALVDATRQIELRTVAGAVETTLPVRVDIRRRMLRTETRTTAKMRANTQQQPKFTL